MKIINILIFAFLSITTLAQDQIMTKTIYDFTVNDISGNEYPLSQLKGKKVMIVNTASKCGLTPQYENLQKLYMEYKEQGLVIIGFPANNFMRQEPGSDSEIASFCEVNYGVTFPMMAKINVTGSKQHELYKYLTKKKHNGYENSKVKWNFQKFLINENGLLVKIMSPKSDPYDEDVLAWLKS